MGEIILPLWELEAQNPGEKEFELSQGNAPVHPSYGTNPFFLAVATPGDFQSTNGFLSPSSLCVRSYLLTFANIIFEVH